MPGLILLLILGGLVLWGLWYLLVKSVGWAFEPIVKYFQESEETSNDVENNVPKEGAGKVVITIPSLQKNGSHKENRIETAYQSSGLKEKKSLAPRPVNPPTGSLKDKDKYKVNFGGDIIFYSDLINLAPFGGLLRTLVFHRAVTLRTRQGRELSLFAVL